MRASSEYTAPSQSKSTARENGKPRSWAFFSDLTGSKSIIIILLYTQKNKSQACVKENLSVEVASSQLGRQVLGPKMGIALQHLEILMTGDAGHFHYPKGAEFKKPTGCLVAQIVKIEVLDSGLVADTLKCLGDSVGA